MYSSSVWIGRPIALQLLALVAMSLSWQVALKSSCQTLPLKAGQTNEQPPSLTVGKHQLNPVAITTPNQVSFGICKSSPNGLFRWLICYIFNPHSLKLLSNKNYFSGTLVFKKRAVCSSECLNPKKTCGSHLAI